jgi:hypothetical protein
MGVVARQVGACGYRIKGSKVKVKVKVTYMYLVNEDTSCNWRERDVTYHWRVVTICCGLGPRAVRPFPLIENQFGCEIRRPVVT